MGAYIAYTALQEVTENAQDDKFWLVCGVNSAIGEITKSIALVEELFATLFGMELLREKNLIPSYTLNRIEDQFVQNHCEHFGPNFRNLYARLSQLYHMFGGEPLRLIAFFAAGDVDSANIVPLLYGDAHLIEAKSEERLDRALEFLERLQSTLSIEWEQVIFTGDWWHKVMYDLLPGYRESFTAYCPLLKTFQSIYEKVRVNSGNLDWNPLHPFLGGNRVLLYVHEPTSSSQLMIPYDLIRSNANALPEEVCEVIVQQFSQKFLRAHSNNRALVYLYNEEYESSEIPGIGVVPTVVEDTDELMPVPLYIPTYDLSSIENHARFDEWLRRREIAVAKMDKLFFYEGL
jgi:hypothetical protein